MAQGKYPSGIPQASSSSSSLRECNQPAPGGVVAMRTAKVIDLVRLGEQEEEEEEELPNAGMWSTFKCN